MVQWMKIKCVTLRSARSYPPRLLFSSSGFFPSKRSATTHANHREREKEGGGKTDRETGRKRNSWSDEKKSNSSGITINEFGRLHVSIPTEMFSPASRAPPLWRKNQGGKKRSVVGGCEMLGGQWVTTEREIDALCLVLAQLQEQAAISRHTLSRQDKARTYAS